MDIQVKANLVSHSTVPINMVLPKIIHALTRASWRREFLS